MTIHDAESGLLNFFAKAESFSLSQDFDDVFPISLEKDKERAIVLAALENLEATHLIKKIKVDEEDLFVLYKPLACYSQKVELSYTTILAITNIVNDTCRQLNSIRDLANPLNLTEKDIINLLVIIGSVKNENQD